MQMSVVRIVNSKPYDWLGTECFIDGKEIPRVKSVDFHVAVDEVPIFNFELMAEPDIEMDCLAQISEEKTTMFSTFVVALVELGLILNTILICTAR